jgi:succinate dehydrogenase / fumarate reductase cytochrome b subunit
MSTVGSKILVAVTGTLLTGFVIVHLVGNLKMFEGAASINAYAVTLKSNSAILWGMRLGLLTVFLIHLVLALLLVKKAYAARPVGYAYPNTIQASWTSRLMPLTGIMILLFVIFHIAHYTVGVVHTAPDGVNYLDLHDPADPAHRHDVYRMVIAGFSTPWISIVYIVAQFLLMLHLAHGIGSVFQTLGLNTQRTQAFFACFSWTVAALIFLGNCAIVIGVWSGQVR